MKSVVFIGSFDEEELRYLKRLEEKLMKSLYGFNFKIVNVKREYNIPVFIKQNKNFDFFVIKWDEKYLELLINIFYDIGKEFLLVEEDIDYEFIKSLERELGV